MKNAGCCFLSLLCFLAPGAAHGQTPDPATVASGARDTLEGAWNGPRARELAAAAVRERGHAFGDDSLRNFRATAQGHVYFLADVGEGESERLVRADQVALRIRWQRPDRALQTIVGRRSRQHLPTRLRYHIDHLSLILDNFGDRIELGEGTEVRDVLHPAAPGAPAFYEYRLADSLEIRWGGKRSRLYRMEVRPRDPDRPAIVGEIFVERESRAIVRMRFTFTSAAYRDPRLKSIEVDLQSALWEGRHWLPAEQRVEIRREVSWMNFPLGGVIRTRIEVDDYQINRDEHGRLPSGKRVATLPEERLAAFEDWRSDLYAGPLRGAKGGAKGAAEADEIRRRARRLVRDRYLHSVVPLGLHVPRVSQVLRARRAEGVLVGGGVRLRPGETNVVTGWAGYPFATGAAQWRARWERPIGALRLGAELYGDRLTDVGSPAVAAGVVSSLGFVTGGDDFTDPYFRDGLRVDLRRPGPEGWSLAVAVEEHERARLAARPPGEAAVRPVRPVDEGTLVSLRAEHRAEGGEILGLEWRADHRFEAATDALGDFGFVRARAALHAASPAGDALRWEIGTVVGTSAGGLPPQRLHLLGGRGTVPGHDFRPWGGDHVALARLTVSHPLWSPWLRLRALAAAGWSGLSASASEAAAGRFGVTGSGGIRPAAGVGVGLLDGALRVDVARGLDGGRWEWIVSTDPKFWEML